MSPSRALLPLVLLAVACGADAPPAPAVAPAPAPPVSGTVGIADADQKLAEIAKAGDEGSRGLLRSFESRVFSPDREGLIEALEGEAVLRADGREGRVSFSFDRAKPPGERLKTDASKLPAGFPADVSEQVQRWINLTCFGAYSFVAYHVPATPLVLAPGKDADSLVIWARPHGSALNVSYVIGKTKQLVSDRAEWTDSQHKFVTKYDWVDLHGRWFLQRSKTLQGADAAAGPVAEFAFDEKDGPFLLRTVHVTDGPRTYDAVFNYKAVRRRPR